jgi:uncharacterized membrane protein YbaN (DUF454 family)
LGIIGIAIPVLPTTPLLLLATFLFAKSSKRFHAWILTTGVYRKYVLPFKGDGGICKASKARILVISILVIGISAIVVGFTVELVWVKALIWFILASVVVWLLYLMLIRIPTIPKPSAAAQQESVG